MTKFRLGATLLIGCLISVIRSYWHEGKACQWKRSTFGVSFSVFFVILVYQALKFPRTMLLRARDVASAFQLPQLQAQLVFAFSTAVRGRTLIPR